MKRKLIIIFGIILCAVVYSVWSGKKQEGEVKTFNVNEYKLHIRNAVTKVYAPRNAGEFERGKQELVGYMDADLIDEFCGKYEYDEMRANFNIIDMLYGEPKLQSDGKGKLYMYATSIWFGETYDIHIIFLMDSSHEIYDYIMY